MFSKIRGVDIQSLSHLRKTFTASQKKTERTWAIGGWIRSQICFNTKWCWTQSGGFDTQAGDDSLKLITLFLSQLTLVCRKRIF